MQCLKLITQQMCPAREWIIMPPEPARIGWRWSGHDSSYPFGECQASGVHDFAPRYGIRIHRKVMKVTGKDTGTRSAARRKASIDRPRKGRSHRDEPTVITVAWRQ